MSEEQKQSQKNAKDSQSEKNQVKASSGWRAFFRKKWTFPAIYMGAAALILALIMWYQGSLADQYSTPDQDLNPDITYQDTGDGLVNEDGSDLAAEDPESVAASNHPEEMTWPFKSDVKADVIMNFYDENADDDLKAAALVKYEDSYWPHQGLDFALQDNKEFEVVAALSGKVVRSEKDPLMGFVIEVESKDGITVLYQSLSESRVNEGDEVEQGQVLGMAGRSRFEKDAGVHLHFEVRKDGVPVSPDTYLSMSELGDRSDESAMAQ